jgi:hypothetical protein
MRATSTLQVRRDGRTHPLRALRESDRELVGEEQSVAVDVGEQAVARGQAVRDAFRGVDLPVVVGVRIAEGLASRRKVRKRRRETGTGCFCGTAGGVAGRPA